MPAASPNERGQQPAHDRDNQRAQEGGTEGPYLNTRDQHRHQPQADRIEDEEEESQAEHREGQGKHHHDRAHGRIDNSEDQRRPEQGGGGRNAKARHQSGRHVDGSGVDENAKEETHARSTPPTTVARGSGASYSVVSES